KQINALLQSQLGLLLLKELDFKEGVIATVIRVEATKDLSICRVFLSVIPEAESRPSLKYLNGKAKTLQRDLSHKLVLRKTPKLIFLHNQDNEEQARVEKLLEEL
ncbi:ribosome-binding factor A, partial [Candidatus Parcubacteria bacterium]|nr:ribosome-binding factor A [Candidatus Parcubacteria bacterium]